MLCTAEPELNMLQDTANSLISPNPEFKPGDIVGWKPHLKNKKQPCSNSLNCSSYSYQLDTLLLLFKKFCHLLFLIHTRVLVPLISTSLLMSSSVCLILMVFFLCLYFLLTSSGDFMLFHYDSRRFYKTD